MFNTLASYLFGGKNNPDIDQDNNSKEASAVVQEESQASTSAILKEIDESLINLTTVCSEEDDEDQDWLLVEKTPFDEDEEEDKDSLSRTDSESELPLVPVTNNYLHLIKKKDEDEHFHRVITSNLPNYFPNTMEESWFVTPPSCFTSQGPIQLETSPLENLLIEHPSMSVYCSFRGVSLPAVSNSVIEDLVVLEMAQESGQEDTVIVQTPLRNRLRFRRRVRNTNNNTNNNNNRQVVQIQQPQSTAVVLAVRTNEKDQENRKQRPSYGKAAMDRSNKTKMVNGRNARQRRNDLQSAKLSSRANNNRKC